ncbi:acetolactate synthase, small subunit [Alkaliphilus metalliredigens QYMF]|uniref:Acetolactate synthase small subunit n=1 Tax=Alkaliphilus metalliredigens (strain QYMF) TaxID=293826 RepID=A6TTM9_ALKMQ|nr:acetolactate synthase small subunit [Alkaliphilus metalliredigens]ABR49547.1 acetolactate synthase, small subunit [Alkaliphilus metalliredigens QYMF]
MPKNINIIIQLTVNNHPGVMSQITGLFTRRAFNLEGILCGRLESTQVSRMYLLVKRDHQVEQIVKQLEKLYDVLDVSLSESYDFMLFDQVHELIKGNSSS